MQSPAARPHFPGWPLRNAERGGVSLGPCPPDQGQPAKATSLQNTGALLCSPGNFWGPPVPYTWGKGAREGVPLAVALGFLRLPQGDPCSPGLEVTYEPPWPPVLQGQAWLQPTIQRNKSELPHSVSGPQIRLEGADQFLASAPPARLRASQAGWGSVPGGTVSSQAVTPAAASALTGVLPPSPLTHLTTSS